METDDLINRAMRSAGGMLGGKGLFVVGGNIDKSHLRIRPLIRVYKDNYVAFTYRVNHGYIMIGIFNTEEAADEYITMIRMLRHDEQGNRIK